MATRKLSFPEKIANILGVIYRYHEPRLPRYKDILKKVAVRELAPPTPKDWPQIKADYAKLDTVMRTQAYRQFKLKEFLVYSAVFVEVLCWFFVGEIIGRGSLTGYIVRGTFVDPKAAKKMAHFKWDDHHELKVENDEEQSGH
ncbi:hypothetical protein niasHT_023184 [Heterodera trifolii]|uniref:Uncharacterized protein n=1 Tax=Heterodera trifolii TaxID=157864 RepID=A0ABD2JD60_9BILA